MRRVFLSLFVVLLLLGVALPFSAFAQDEPVVRAVLFYSPTCPHCHKVIQEDLPPLVEKYGKQLQILLIDVTTEGGRELYLSAVQAVPIPDDMRGVPALVVGETLLVGDKDIPEQLPGIIEQGLASGGIDWPAIPGMDRVLKEAEAQQAAAQTPAAQETPSAGETPQATTAPASPTSGASLNPVDVRAVSEMSVSERLALDPVGSAIAIISLIFMVGMLVWTIVYWAKSNLTLTPGPSWINWALPILSIIGMGIAFYLAFVETTGAEAVCGPVGNCNVVQQSDYAVLFGILPVGVAGLIGYIVILSLWAWQRFGPADKIEKTAWMLPFVVFFGVAFSAYLTFLEPFVIGAICMWCMTSAWIMTILLFLTFRWTIPRKN
jgi:uncharacterized membrane protein/glutaredoxin